VTPFFPRLTLLLALAACSGPEGGSAPVSLPAPPPPRPAAGLPAGLPPAAPPAAAPAALGLGRAATPTEIAAWDRDVHPSGEGLPPGRGSVADGKVLYTAQCAACHGLKGEGGVGPKLFDPALPTTGFGEEWRGHERIIGNWWPYATTVFDYVQRAMPQTAPGSLTPDQVYALTAFLLAENGAVGADFVADAKSLPGVKMPTKIQFVPDDREGTAEFR
jgi:mono/diheme cytochrome c family protein